MAEGFDLDDYTCKDMPSTLWRVTHPQTQSKFLAKSFVAADYTRIFSDESSLKTALEEHFRWANRLPTPFLSCFSDERHARSWADWAQRRKGTACTHEIDTTNLVSSGVHIFCAETVAARLGIAHKYAEDEYIFLHRIPHEALRCVREHEHRESRVDYVETILRPVRIVVFDTSDSDEPSEEAAQEPNREQPEQQSGEKEQAAEDMGERVGEATEHDLVIEGEHESESDEQATRLDPFDFSDLDSALSELTNDMETHYVSELGGWYNSDDECEERNRLDDIVRFLEDN
ncbi:hypothetical protein F5Y17DRAFT_47988 [Xylariaceae sp. FL0594]|nr:hypothetical protein F5Y17DRAFT_47988 [Xylariaceae sp. FL0594]